MQWGRGSKINVFCLVHNGADLKTKNCYPRVFLTKNWGTTVLFPF